MLCYLTGSNIVYFFKRTDELRGLSVAECLGDIGDFIPLFQQLHAIFEFYFNMERLYVFSVQLFKLIL